MKCLRDAMQLSNEPMQGEHLTEREYCQAIIDRMEMEAWAHRARVTESRIAYERDMAKIRMVGTIAVLRTQAQMWRDLANSIRAGKVE